MALCHRVFVFVMENVKFKIKNEGKNSKGVFEINIIKEIPQEFQQQFYILNSKFSISG